RISTLESPGVLGTRPVTCTSRNFVGVSSSSRFFHTKKYGRHKPCSRQNTFTLCPLRACSETSLRHFVHAFFERLVMSQHCIATRIFTRWGSLSAHYANAGCGETPLRTVLPRGPGRLRRSQQEEYGVGLENPQSRRGKGPAFPKSGKGSECARGSPQGQWLRALGGTHHRLRRKAAWPLRLECSG